jgi:hypothetical protein
MAIIRNTLIAAFRLTGWDNLEQARRHFSHVISDASTSPPNRSNRSNMTEPWTVRLANTPFGAQLPTAQLSYYFRRPDARVIITRY